MRRPGRVGPDQHAAAMGGGDLADRVAEQVDVVLGVVGVRVPRPQPDREEFAGVVAPHPERMEPEPALEVRRRLLLLRVGGDQRRIHIEHHDVAEIGASDRRRRQPGRQQRPHVPADLGPGRRRSASTRPG